MNQNSLEIKKQFLDFFASKGHKIVPSAPVVVKGDPTLMFTNAGMNQFKDFFLGNATATDTRVANSQKCLRVSGKHNDLEEVGHDHYHHTLFEMLGNWSFGDYFKRDAILWAWELLTDVYKLPKDRLYVTVFEGDEASNIPFDQEAFDIWAEVISPERILKGNKKDNFWEMGDTGPCGPCTEIHFDMRDDDERASLSGALLVNNDHPEVIEIWNNVFMEFNRKADGSLVNLPAKHVDTGMGFERLVRVIQNKKSNYDTDIFQYIIRKTETLSGKKYGDDEAQDIAFRVIADHIRAVTMVIADGQIPSNAGAGYVVRRILRRAVRYGYSYLGFESAFMHELVAELADYFKDSFTEIIQQKDFIARVIKEEENSFFRTLSTGIQRLNHYFAENPGKNIAGSVAFELYDTFGFPIDLTEVIAREKGLTLDHAGFEAALLEQKNRSKADAKKELGDWVVLNENSEETFCGYDQTSVKTDISRYRTVLVKGKSFTQIILGDSPFYAESGGQVGDRGMLIGEDGERIEIIDTQKENKLHICITESDIKNANQLFTAAVDAHSRLLISSNHSATHLMHSALREVLGEHVAQKGSLVNDKALRFDFSHFGKMSDEEIQKVEVRVNEKIRENISLNEYRNLPIEEAKNMGAMALFGEKYGEFVRAIEFDRNYSIELCGGTHVKNTGEIGLFKLLSEGSVSAGIRRIEAVTNEKAWEFYNDKIAQLDAISSLLNGTKNALESVEKLIDENQKLKSEIEKFQLQQVAQVKDFLMGRIQSGICSFIAEKVDIPNAEAAKQLCFQLKQEHPNLVTVLVYEIDSKPGIAVYIDETLVESHGWNASQWVRDWGKHIQGGGGGQPFFATAGGKNAAGIEQVLDAAKQVLVGSR